MRGLQCELFAPPCHALGHDSCTLRLLLDNLGEIFLTDC